MMKDLHDPKTSLNKLDYGDITTSTFSFENNEELPLVITRCNKSIPLRDLITDNKEHFEDALVHHGAILFRGFGICSIDEFNSLMECYSNEPVPYMFRSSPRHSLSDRVYVSTTYPSGRTIKMHSESSYSFAWGRKIFFCCIEAPIENGETPIADNRKVLGDISPELQKKFEEKGVLYQRNLSSEIGMPWPEVFQTNSIAEVKRICRENNIQADFKSSDNLVIKWKRPAIYHHPVTNERIWFNHSFFFNRYSILEEMGIEYNNNTVDDILPSDTFFGDGSPISYEEYLQIKNAYEKEKVSFRWENGDVLLLDNMLTAHGRAPYKGKRQIVVSIVEPYADEKA